MLFLLLLFMSASHFVSPTLIVLCVLSLLSVGQRWDSSTCSVLSSSLFLLAAFEGIVLEDLAARFTNMCKFWRWISRLSSQEAFVTFSKFIYRCIHALSVFVSHFSYHICFKLSIVCRIEAPDTASDNLWPLHFHYKPILSCIGIDNQSASGFSNLSL